MYYETERSSTKPLNSQHVQVNPLRSRIMEEGFVECTLFYCFYEKMAYVTETVKSHLADFTSVSQLVSQNEKVHTRWGCCGELPQTLERKSAR